jgi:hypothetical protein
VLHIIDHQSMAIVSYKQLLTANSCFGANMLVCELCKQPKASMRTWPLLRVVDESGKRTVDPFNGGLLCDHCHEEAQKIGSLEHLWVLEQISKTPRRRRAQQY